MENKNLAQALKAFEKDFGFSFDTLLSSPSKCQQKIKDEERKLNQDSDTMKFCQIYDNYQVKIYNK